jgi:hypothetical protein
MGHDRDGGKRTNWLLIKHHDEEAIDSDGAAILEQDTSVASGRTLKEITEGKGKKPTTFMAAGDAIAADASGTAVNDSPRKSFATSSPSSRSCPLPHLLTWVLATCFNSALP